MFEHHGWIKIRASADYAWLEGPEEGLSAETEAQIRSLMESMSDYGLMQLAQLNVEPFIHMAGVPNHRGRHSDLILDLFTQVGRLAPAPTGCCMSTTTKTSTGGTTSTKCSGWSAARSPDTATRSCPPSSGCLRTTHPTRRRTPAWRSARELGRDADAVGADRRGPDSGGAVQRVATHRRTPPGTTRRTRGRVPASTGPRRGRMGRLEVPRGDPVRGSPEPCRPPLARPTPAVCRRRLVHRRRPARGLGVRHDRPGRRFRSQPLRLLRRPDRAVRRRRGPAARPDGLRFAAGGPPRPPRRPRGAGRPGRDRTHPGRTGLPRGGLRRLHPQQRDAAHRLRTGAVGRQDRAAVPQPCRTGLQALDAGTEHPRRPFTLGLGRLQSLCLGYELADGTCLIMGFGDESSVTNPTDRAELEAAVREYYPDAEVLAVDAHDWNADPLFDGTYRIDRPGEAHDFIRAMSQPENRVVFAGTDVDDSVWRIWIEGAVNSGHRAADQVAAVLSR